MTCLQTTVRCGYVASMCRTRNHRLLQLLVAISLVTDAVESRADGAPRTWGTDEGDAAQTFPEPRRDIERAPPPSTTQPPTDDAQRGEPPPRAYLDYSDGTFYLRSASDNLIIATGGRVHIDAYGFAGPRTHDYHRANGTGLVPHIFFRRFVLESGGIIRKTWFYWIGGNFAPTQVDSNESPTSTAAVYDGFIGYQWPHAQLYVGQYNAPFTMENVTSSRWLDFMERALSVRALGAPYNKDLGVTFWGASGDGVAPLEYQVGLFGGDGMNRPNVDNRVDAMARVLLRPFASSTKDAIHRLHAGVSARAGSRDDAYVNYDAPAISTPGGYAFWSPSYTADDKSEVHVIPSGNQIAGAGEVYVPFERFDLRGELVYVNEERREALAADRKSSLRRGRLEGFGGYVQASWWPFGSPRINGHPAGRYIGLRAPKDRGAEYPFGLQLVLRGEILRLTYDGKSRSPNVDDGKRSGDIDVNAAQVAANWWATKHVRLTGEYSLYGFPRASSTSVDVLHEISFRLGLAL